MSTEITLDESPMAKKKAVPKRRGRPRLPSGVKSGRFSFRASEEWLAWLERFGRSEMKDKAVLIRDAFRTHAKAKGFELPPEDPRP